MTLQECYSKIGGDYSEVISRLPGDKFVERFVFKFLDDKSFETLCSALKEQNPEEAFRAAHTIKGVCQNLSFTALCEVVAELTEQLRDRKIPEDLSKFEEVKEQYENTIAGILEYKISL